MATVIIPTPLRKFTSNFAKVTIHATRVSDLVRELTENFPDLKRHLIDPEGKIASFINIFVDKDDIRNLKQQNTEINDGSVVSIVPAIAGGSNDIDSLRNHDGQFSREELLRYNRHIIIPGFGLSGQQKLKEAKVLVVGSGGLGSPLLLYLAAAGVGTIGIVDYDVVEDSNLHRQVLFDVGELGVSKVEAAKRRLQNLNPHIILKVYNLQLTSKNALSLIQEYDVVADGTDNFPTRYLVNDACVLLDKPNVFASIFQFEGQVTVFNYLNDKGVRGPNYRDLYSTPPPAGLVPSCAEGGVLGVLPGIIGSMQALEVIKVITGIGEVLDGKLFAFDALTSETRIFNIKRNSSNPLNGDSPTIRELIDYEHFCGVKVVERKVKEIEVSDLYAWQVRGDDFQLIDVREPHEFVVMNLEGQLFPLASVSDHSDKISRDKKVVVHCRSGARSAMAIRELEDNFGFENLYNLKGGIVAYMEQIQPVLMKSMQRG